MGKSAMRLGWVLLPLVTCGLPLEAEGAAVPVDVGYFGSDARVVNFDTAPDGTPLVTGQLLGGVYAAWGITFGDEDGVTNWAGIATSPPNRAWGSPNGLNPIDCYFPGGVLAVGAHGFDFRLEVFDAGGALILSVGYTDGTAGLFSDTELGFLGIASDTPIAHARFTRYWSNQSLYGFEIDDLRFLPDASTAARRTSWGQVKSAMRGGH